MATRAVDFKIEREDGDIKLLSKEIKGHVDLCYIIIDGNEEYSMQFCYQYALDDFLHLVKEKEDYEHEIKLFDSLKLNEYFYIVNKETKEKFLKITDSNNAFVGVTDGSFDDVTWIHDEFSQLYYIELIPEEKQEFIRNFLKNV